jgi:hypothetical protein
VDTVENRATRKRLALRRSAVKEIKVAMTNPTILKDEEKETPTSYASSARRRGALLHLCVQIRTKRQECWWHSTSLWKK